MKLRRISKAKMASLLSITFIGVYFSYHILYGYRGYFALVAKKQALLEKTKILSALEKKRDHIAHKSNLLQSKIDKELLEQQSWLLLRHVPEDRIVIFLIK